ncbi:MAG: RNA polymerase-binding protein DksA [Desulfobulbaceae bacterium]|nr:RNA polymerase-binding protein DksA [Desulfobulbaceae bacterium]
MTNEELQIFKKQLEGMKESINADVERTLDTLTSQSGNIPDPNDRASMESDLSFELRIRERERRLGEKIDEALARISDGSYGVCTGCGQDISIQRLQARPVTELCIECKTKQEQREKEQGR